MDLTTLDWAIWRSLPEASRTEHVRAAANAVGGTFTEGLYMPTVDVRGCAMLLVPGGRVDVGWAGAPAKLTAEQRAHWSARSGYSGSFEDFLGTYLGPARTIVVPAMLVERAPTSVEALGIDPYEGDVEDVVRRAVASGGFRLLSDDEWENAARAGVSTLFAWGDEWPPGEPYGSETTFTRHRERNRIGMELLTDPYDVEIVAERDAVRGGDGGTALCGGRPEPEAWYSFALAFRYPRSLWEDVVPELFERAFVRRCLPLR